MLILEVIMLVLTCILVACACDDMRDRHRRK
jgi:hypothetical protein